MLAFQSSELPQVPDLPVLGKQLPEAVRQEVNELHARARKNPQDVDTIGPLAMLMHAYEQYQFAEFCYRRAQELQPDSFQWSYYLGLVQARQGEHQEAADSLRKALLLDPNYVPAWLKLVGSLLQLEQFEEAATICQAILREYPQAAVAHYGLGRVKAQQGNLEEAVSHYLKACELHPGFGASHYALGLAYRDLGNNAKAREHLSLYQQNKLGWPSAEDPLWTAVQQLKSGPLHHLKLAIDLANENRLEQSIREHQKALELDPNLLQAHVNLSNLQGRLGNWKEAEKHYQAAAAINPNLPDLHYNYGIILGARERHAEAAEAFQKALEINPFYAEAHNNLGSMLALQGDLHKAARHYRQAIENNPNYRLARFNLGRTLIALGEHQEAIDQLLKILTPEDEDTPRFMFVLAAAYARSGNVEKALFYTREAKERAEALGQMELAASAEEGLKQLEQARRPQ
ncbi:MAG: tetratricopeptide repeat protein [Acidobacteriota bacterium]